MPLSRVTAAAAAAAVVAWVALVAAPAAAQGRAATAHAVDRVVAGGGTKPIPAPQGEGQLVLAPAHGAKNPANTPAAGPGRGHDPFPSVVGERLRDQAR